MFPVRFFITDISIIQFVVVVVVVVVAMVVVCEYVYVKCK